MTKLVCASYIQHKADVIVLHVLLLPCRFSNFYLATYPSFIKWPPMRSCIFFDPRPLLEGSYEIGSVRPSFHLSFRLSVSFLRIGSLVFSEAWHGVRGPCIVVCDRSRKKAAFLLVINNPIIYKFFKDFTNHRKKTNRAVVFSCRLSPTFVNTGTTD